MEQTCNLESTWIILVKHLEKIKDKPIEELTRDEILTRMTFLVRGERFCDGTIEKALNDGTLEALSVRLHEITKPGGSK